MIARRPRRSACAEQGRGRAAMRRAEDRGQRRAIGIQLGDQALSGRGGQRLIGEGRLGGKRVAVQPADQLLAIAADNIELRKVQVRVDESSRSAASPKSTIRASGYCAIISPASPSAATRPASSTASAPRGIARRAQAGIGGSERVADYMPDFAAKNGAGRYRIQSKTTACHVAVIADRIVCEKKGGLTSGKPAPKNEDSAWPAHFAIFGEGGQGRDTIRKGWKRSIQHTECSMTPSLHPLDFPNCNRGIRRASRILLGPRSRGQSRQRHPRARRGTIRSAPRPAADPAQSRAGSRPRLFSIRTA